MAGHVGIVGCSAEGAALCYREISREGASLMGSHNHPEISVHTFPLAVYMEAIREDRWDRVADLLLASARKLESAGVDFIICPDNTIHQVFDQVSGGSRVPWIHIAEPVKRMAEKQGLENLLLLGTKYLMTGPVYPDFFRNSGISLMIPGEQDRELIDSIIFRELVYGVCTSESRDYFNSVIHLSKDNGADGVLMGCTEIPLLLVEPESPLPLLDSTRLLADAAVERALGELKP